MARTILTLQDVHHDMLEYSNGELAMRPTFKQTMDSFRQVIPTIVDARIAEESKRPYRAKAAAAAKKAAAERNAGIIDLNKSQSQAENSK